MKKIYLCFKSDQPMFNTLFSVSDAANTDRYYTGLAEAGTGVLAGTGNASFDVSGCAAWNRRIGFSQEGFSKHDDVPADEKISWLGDGGALLVGDSALERGGKNSRMFTYTQDAVVYGQYLWIYKQVIWHL